MHYDRVCEFVAICLSWVINEKTAADMKDFPFELQPYLYCYVV